MALCSSVIGKSSKRVVTDVALKAVRSYEGRWWTAMKGLNADMTRKVVSRPACKIQAHTNDDGLLVSQLRIDDNMDVLFVDTLKDVSGEYIRLSNLIECSSDTRTVIVSDLPFNTVKSDYLISSAVENATKVSPLLFAPEMNTHSGSSSSSSIDYPSEMRGYAEMCASLDESSLQGPRELIESVSPLTMYALQRLHHQYSGSDQSVCFTHISDVLSLVDSEGICEELDMTSEVMSEEITDAIHEIGSLMIDNGHFRTVLNLQSLFFPHICSLAVISDDLFCMALREILDHLVWDQCQSSEKRNIRVICSNPFSTDARTLCARLESLWSEDGTEYPKMGIEDENEYAESVHRRVDSFRRALMAGGMRSSLMEECVSEQHAKQVQLMLDTLGYLHC